MMRRDQSNGDDRSCSAVEVRRSLSYLMPQLSEYWQRPLHTYASSVYDIRPLQSESVTRNRAANLLAGCIERAARRSGFSDGEARCAGRELLAAPVLQTGPHCLLLVEPDAFYTHLFSLLGLKDRGREWHITYFVSTTTFKEKAKKGPGWLCLEGEPLNLFGLPRSKMDDCSVGCPNGPYRFALSNSKGHSAPNASAARLLANLPAGEFETAAEAIKAGNRALWQRHFCREVKLLQLDDFDVADLVAAHLDDPVSWMSRDFVGNGAVADRILKAIDRLNAGPWGGWVRRTTDFFWRLERDRVTPLQLQDGLLRSRGASGFEVKFDRDGLTEALRTRAILPNLFTAFVVISILPGTRVLGGCRQSVYFPLMRYLMSVGVGRSGEPGLPEALMADDRPGVWGHRVLRPTGGYPFQEVALAGGVAPLLSRYAEMPLAQSSGDLASFTGDPIWAELCGHIADGTITCDVEEWRWSGF